MGRLRSYLMSQVERPSHARRNWPARLRRACAALGSRCEAIRLRSAGRPLAVAAASLLSFLMPEFAAAQGLGARQVPGMRQAEVHQPWSPRYNSLTPDGFARRQVLGQVNGWSGTSFVFGVGSAGCFPAWNAFPCWNNVGFGGWPYAYYGTFAPGWAPFYGPPMFGPVVVAPLMIPAEVNYGPQATRRLMGLDPPLLPAAAPADAAVDVGAGANVGGFGVLAPEEADPAQPRRRISNAESRARAQRLIVAGDANFARQSYSSANQRYKSAAQSAPDLGDGYLRQGFALIALGRYEAAARSFKRGLVLLPDWPSSDFRLDALYGDNELAKSAHMDAVAQAAARQPGEDLLFVLGVMLYFDGQPDRARPFFLRAKALAIDGDAHVAGFLREIAPPAAQAPVVNAGAPGPVPAARPAALPDGVDL